MTGGEIQRLVGAVPHISGVENQLGVVPILSTDAASHPDDRSDFSRQESDTISVRRQNKADMDPHARSKAANMTSYVAMFFNIILVFVKFLAGFFGHSSALVADAVHSLSDLISDLIVLAVTYIASKPADKGHTYGYSRVEVVGSVFVGFMLFIAAFLVVEESFQAFVQPQATKLAWYTLLAAVSSVLIKEALFQYTFAVGKRIKSQVVVANAFHHRSDAISSIVATVGIVISLWAVSNKFDAISGFIVAGIIAFYGAKTLYQSFCTLSDQLPSDIVDKVNILLQNMVEIEDYSDIRARDMGAFLIVDLCVYLLPNTYIEDTEYIQLLVEKKIKRQCANVSEVIVRMKAQYSNSNNNRRSMRRIIIDTVSKLSCVREITQCRVFGPAPYSVDIHYTTPLSLSHCEQHHSVNTVRLAIQQCGDTKLVHVGLEFDCVVSELCFEKPCCESSLIRNRLSE